MKKHTLLFVVLLASALTFSQSKLNLKINHKLGVDPFAFNSQKTNNLGNQININRLQYYLTVVSITHDGGTVTPINKVLLVDAGMPLLDSLTTLNITTLENVTIAVGVDSSLNHLDPSLYYSTNSLAPKSPSMHWGWTPGYRFVAMEGTSFSITPNRPYELHSLGDVSYFNTTISTAGVTTSGEKTIELNADYLESLRDIDVSNGPLNHGESKINKKHLENFRDHVFTSIEGNPSVGIEIPKTESIDFSISPNPATENTNISITFAKQQKNMTLVITDMSGKVVQERKVNSTTISINNLTQGIYICSVKNSDELSFGSRKFVVTK